jgi:hypothetical protein
MSIRLSAVQVHRSLPHPAPPFNAVHARKAARRGYRRAGALRLHSMPEQERGRYCGTAWVSVRLQMMSRSRLTAPLLRAAKNVARTVLYRGYHKIPDDYGVLRSVSKLSARKKSIVAGARNYRARAEIALDVASNYPGGDYLEFGAGSLQSFRSFLAAFDLNGLATRFPDTRFYAFDIFGDPDQGSGPPPDERAYFEHWRNPFDLAAPLASLKTYGALKDRCVIVPGYFQDTLNNDLKKTLRDRKIGFAFLDCNIASSYKLAFDFLLDVMKPSRMFIEIDEYFEEHKPSIHPLYQEFAAQAKARFNLDSLYMRNAGAFGALFCLIPAA